MKLLAVTRPVPDSLAHCELTHIERTPIDAGRARAQHSAYERALTSLGCEVVSVTAAHDQPDSVFIEDTAIVLEDLAVIARPGAGSRRAETAAVASTLVAFRQLQFLSEPATLDGGDVLVLGRRVLVGLSTRTNEEGVRQLARLVAPFGYSVEGVLVNGCLHLKSAATQIGPERVLCNPDWIPAHSFDGFEVLAVDPDEPAAANVLRVGDAIVAAAAHPRTAERLSCIADVRPVDVSELSKAEAGVTCCSLIVR